MASNQRQRYEPVSTSEPPSPPPVPVTLTISPPPDGAALYSPPPPYEPSTEQDTIADSDLPPSYDIAAKLPTYEEAERVKEQYTDLVERNALLIDGGIVSFVFNWLGFFAAYCMTKTVAGRYGAISGFGLSVVKWVLILKNAASDEVIVIHSWIWWLFLALGWLIFVRSILVYVHIKWWVKKGCRSFPRYWGIPGSN
ncbi:NEDD4 family-interacting protein 2-like isoform X2 [Porites lutea]|uniref:NEDD4 family-interacting protein 2-like isoform X2 n=1 Tax=Porites lutea TaxID=51062 RepID=UPI003CC5965D